MGRFRAVLYRRRRFLSPARRRDCPVMSRFHLHLVSDATGDTVHSVARACLVQFENTEAVEHIWSMVRTKAQIERVVNGVAANPGVVLYTLVDDTLRG